MNDNLRLTYMGLSSKRNRNAPFQGVNAGSSPVSPTKVRGIRDVTRDIEHCSSED